MAHQDFPQPRQYKVIQSFEAYKAGPEGYGLDGIPIPEGYFIWGMLSPAWELSGTKWRLSDLECPVAMTFTLNERHFCGPLSGMWRIKSPDLIDDPQRHT